MNRHKDGETELRLPDDIRLQVDNEEDYNLWNIRGTRDRDKLENEEDLKHTGGSKRQYQREYAHDG